MLAPPTAVRCEAHYKTGLPCRREAIPGGNVCGQHGGLIPAVRATAAARIGNAADDMVKRLQAMLDDPSVEARDKIKVAQDLLDRAGLNATDKLIVEVDPVEVLFRNLLSDPAGLSPAVQVQQIEGPDEFDRYNREALEAYGGDDRDDVVDAEVVEDDPAPEETMSSRPPKHIREALERLI